MKKDLKERKIVINTFFRMCKNSDLTIDHKLIDRFFSNKINKVIVEILAVKRHTNLIHAVIDKREISSFYEEAINRLDKIPEIKRRNRMHEQKHRKYYAKLI